MAHSVTNYQARDRFDAYVAMRVENRGMEHAISEMWPAVVPALDLADVMASSTFAPHTTRLAIRPSADSSGLREDALIVATVEAGMVRIVTHGVTVEAAKVAMTEAKGLFPRSEDADPDVVPITFWTYGQHGPRAMRRDLDADAWEAISDNYAGGTGPALADLMSPDFRPGIGGQLVLWHGDPGTGKTTALRALAREWRDWCEVHYVVDPDRFFGFNADYMMDVLMGSADGEVIDETTGEGRGEARWRLLILEDCGEMLQPDARREMGQALSRFLNACDGLVGRGLRVMVLVTTNEKIDKLHEAVARPGRCAARVEFETFSALAAEQWLERHGKGCPPYPRGATTLADLYAVKQERVSHQIEHPVGFAA